MKILTNGSPNVNVSQNFIAGELSKSSEPWFFYSKALLYGGVRPCPKP